jgi:hypothetical protein
MRARFRFYLIGVLLIAAAFGFSYWQMSNYSHRFDLQHTGRDTVAEVVQVTSQRSSGRKQRIYYSAKLRFDRIDFDRGTPPPHHYSRFSSFPTISVGESVRVGDRFAVMYDPTHPQSVVRGRTTDGFWALLRANGLVDDFVLRCVLCLVAIVVLGTLAWCVVVVMPKFADAK